MTRISAFEPDLRPMTCGPRVELRNLRMFVAVVDHGSFRKAADSLAIRQSTVSRRVCDLEQSLGAPLFTRHPSGVLVTEAGQCFCPAVRSLMGQLAEATGTVAGGAETRREPVPSGRTCTGSRSVPITAITCVACEMFDGEHPLAAFRLRS